MWWDLWRRYDRDCWNNGVSGIQARIQGLILGECYGTDSRVYCALMYGVQWTRDGSGNQELVFREC